MEKYWKNQPQAPSRVLLINKRSGNVGSASVLSDYDQYHFNLLSTTECDGWMVELHCYLKDMPADVSSETDVVEWWQVCPTIFIHNILCSSLKSLESLHYVSHP
jgi:hypothetical protein